MRALAPRIMMGLLLTAGIALLAGCPGKQTQTAQEGGSKAQPVKVAPVQRGEVVLAHETTGTVTAGTEADVAAKMEQRITALPFREGDAVQAGAILARLDSAEAQRQVDLAAAEAGVARAQLRDLLAGSRPEEIAQAQAALRQAEASEKKAAQSLLHAQEVYGQGGLPDQMIAAAAGRAEVAKSQVETAKANLENARQNSTHVKEQYDLDAEPRLRVQEAEGRLRSAEAQLAAAQTSVADAQRDVDRLAEMLKIGGASQEDLDKAQARSDTAQAQLRSAEASRDTAREALTRTQEIYQLKAQPQQQLDDARTKLEAAQAQLATAQETLRAAETDYQHVQRLYSGPIPQRELDDAQSRLAEARAATEAARQRLALLRAGATDTQVTVARERVHQAEAKLAAAKVGLSYCTVTAPVSGTVIRRYLDLGDLAGPRTPILTLGTTGHLVVKAALADRYAADLQLGAPVTINAPTLHKPLTLSVTRLYGSADAQTRLMPFETALPGQLKLPVGSLVQVRLVVQKATGVPVVPAEALLSRPNGQRVAFVVEGETAHQRSVKVGLEADGKVEVTEGLKVGDKLVVGGQEMLRDGMPVKVAGKGGPAGASPGGAEAKAGAAGPVGQATGTGRADR